MFLAVKQFTIWLKGIPVITIFRKRKMCIFSQRKPHLESLWYF